MTALEYYMNRFPGSSVVCLLPPVWRTPRAIDRVRGESAALAAARDELATLIEASMAEWAPEGAADGAAEGALPPVVRWAIDNRAVLVSNASLSGAVAAYRDPQHQEAMRAWLREWVWRYELRRTPRGEAHAQEEEWSFVPDAHFAAPPEAPLQLLRGGGLTPAVSSLFMSSHLEQLRGVELPATAVERRRRVEALVLHVHRQATGGGEASFRQLGFKQRKDASDVLNKFIFISRTPESLVDDCRSARTAPEPQVDAVLPSHSSVSS
mmetsp:Transcript_33828/g.107978  ORF Transcript_33828/g.107978 Transcript_33828/m.107978 type:complete len:267 (+) Transcript_33828:261-1061(+)